MLTIQISFTPQIDKAKHFAPSLEFLNSSTSKDCSCQTDFAFDIKPDVCVYPNESGCRGPTDIVHAKLTIEFKWHLGDDPFCTPYSIGEGNDKKTSFLHDTKAGTNTAGQITAYVAAQLGAQFCTCAYSILIVRSVTRLIQWDRTGAIVSEPINYNQNPALAEFFRQYHKAPQELRGIDTTATELTADEKCLARKCLGINDTIVLLKISVPTPNSQRWYVIRALMANHYTPPGRATRGFEAYDIERCRKVFVKDMWQVDLAGIEKEGDTYQLLWAAQVQNLAICSASGDIGDHTTRTHLYKDAPWACDTKRDLVLHHHYQLMLDTIG
jgi:Fungal protein kinase